MVYLDDEAVLGHSTPEGMIEALGTAFMSDTVSPLREHHHLPAKDATLLLMPAWRAREAIGVKIATVFPENSARGKPTVDGVYLLLDGETGSLRAILSARMLTQLRTAAVSALASSLLARETPSTLLMVGTGALAPHLIRAHLAVRPLERVLVWGRSRDKAEHVVNALSSLDCRIEVAGDLRRAVASADIVSCATLSSDPLVQGDDVRPGTHVDLVGSFTPDMREADNGLVAKAQIFVDTANAFSETGDLIDPVNEGILDPADVRDLRALLLDRGLGRKSDDAITLFKSVGTGLADLAAAEYVTGIHAGRPAASRFSRRDFAGSGEAIEAEIR